MAPIKRPRGVASGDVVEVLDEASSNFQSRNQRKRPRLSDVESPSDDTTVLADEDESEQYPSTEQRLRGNHKADYQRRRDEEDAAEDSDDEEIQERATQAIRQRNEMEMDNQAAEAGVIEEVICTNFMCHSKLSVTFGPLINFIIGHNGSGKSAVLTAITLCLGGKATSTNRGQSLKSFVKEGQEYAALSVKLKNRGETAFRHDVYGDSITVERHFNTQGTSGFKIKSADGRIISTKRSELDDITDFYALQLDNPVNVLTQDMARQFLNNSTPSDKYKFFIKGVQLEQLDNDYILLANNLDGTDAQIEHVTEDCNALKEKAQQAAEKLRLSDRQDSLRDKIRKYSRQMAWAQVEEAENETGEFDRKVQVALDKIQEREEGVNSVAEEFDRLDTLRTQAISSHAELLATAEPLQQRLNEANERTAEVEEEQRTAMNEQRQLRDAVGASRNKIKKLQSEIDAERRRLEAADGGNYAAKLLEIDQAKNSGDEARTQRDAHGRQNLALENAVSEAATKLSDARDQQKAKREDVDRAQGRLKSLRDTVPSHDAAFHVNLPKLRKAIEKETRFVEKPLGPLASHIKLLKAQWSSVLETYFGGGINGFIVTNKPDQHILSELMKRTGCEYPVFIGNKSRINTTSNEPDSTFNTIMRVLVIDNDLVRNQLIIVNNIEQVLLIEDPQEASATMFDQSAAPRHVRGALSLLEKGDGLYYRRGEGGNQKSDPVKAFPGVARMKTDKEAQIRMAEDALKEAKQELENSYQYVRAVELEQLEAKQAVTRHRRTHDELVTQVQTAEDEVERLEGELEDLTPQDGKLDQLRASLAQAENERIVNEGQFDESTTAVDATAARLNQLSSERDLLNQQMESHGDKVTVSNDKIQKLANDRQFALRQKNEAVAALEDAKKRKEEADADKERHTAHVEDFVRQASGFCERVPVDRGETPKSLDNKLTRLYKDRERYEQQLGGSHEHIAQLAAESKQRFRAAEIQMKLLEQIASMLTRSLGERRERWKNFRKEISGRARIQFYYLLLERGFRGTLTLDHLNKALDLAVEPDETRRDSSGRQTKTLSGGEKSFSTICLLLALWDAMGSPIRCLDEFDVFMDSVNRDESMRMIIKAARRSIGRQYILITPQSMNNVNFGPDVRIHRLSDPERGQTSLELGGSS